MLNELIILLIKIFLVVIIFVLIDGVILNPYAGGEIHRITSFSSEAWKYASFKVLVEYCVLSMLIFFVLYVSTSCGLMYVVFVLTIILINKLYYIFGFSCNKIELYCICSLTLISMTFTLMVFFSFYKYSKYDKTDKKCRFG